MSDTTNNLPIIPVARTPISIRPATLADVPFIDGLQKMHTHMVGWMPTKQIEGKIGMGHVLVAWATRPCLSEKEIEDTGGSPVPLGYVIAHDQYMKRDDVGIIYQLNVLPLKQRNLIGATLIKGVFDRAAYGCRLFCLWCAQDIQANYFWESIGFIPLAFRTGSRSKQRIHIFWQRRIRENDQATPYWYPSKTGAGSVREDRLVLPIPIETHWRDAMPVVLPALPQEQATPAPKSLPPTRPVESLVQQSQSQRVAIVRSQSRHLQGLPPGKAAVVTANGIRYIERGDYVPEVVPEIPKPKRVLKPRAVSDPKLALAAREVRDRHLELINSGKLLPGATAKYEVGRALPEPAKRKRRALSEAA